MKKVFKTWVQYELNETRYWNRYQRNDSKNKTKGVNKFGKK